MESKVQNFSYVEKQTNENSQYFNALTKQSSESEIKSYFLKIFELNQQDEEFPVDLEDVWPLVYARKEEAVRALKSIFIQGIDFQTLRKNAERGAASPIVYKLTTSCLEYFIARKVQPVFEVYRQVFHKVAEVETPEMIMAKALKIADASIKNQKQRIQMLEGENEAYKDEIKTLAPKATYTDEVLQSTSTFTTTQMAKSVGLSALTLNKKLHDLGVQYKQGGQWFLYHKYQGKGYTEARVYTFVKIDGEPGTSEKTVWTEKGRQFIHGLRKEGRL